MNAFKLSGEKSAAVAPVIWKCTLVLLVVSKMYTSLGLDTVSETTAFAPLGEIASTLPTTAVNSLTDGVLVVGLNAIKPRVPKKPFVVPSRARLPAGLNTSELGVV